MFDIGQNDLAGAFYSKTLDQVLASIPTILLEFETGIKVGVKLFHIIIYSIESTTYFVIKEISLCFMFGRDYMMRGQDISGYTIQVLLDAYLRMLPNLELIHQSLMNKDVLAHTTKLLKPLIYSFILCVVNCRVNIQIQMSHMLISSP
jgi:hypothetical protein